MHTRTSTVAAGVALLLAATACTSGGSDTLESLAKAGAAQSSSKPASEPPPEANGLAFGSRWTWDEPEDDQYSASKGSATPLGYVQPVTASATAEEEFGRPGHVWAGLEVKVCLITGGSYITSQPWTLSYKDGKRLYPSAITYDDFPQPAYPTEEVLLDEGECVRGTIVFAVPGGQRPDRVIYEAGDRSEPADWAVPRA